MPNTSRTKRRSQKRRTNTLSSALPNVWASGGSQTELKSYLGSVNNQQLYHDTTASMGNSVNLLVDIVQGSNYYNRIGNRIYLKSLEVFLVLNNKNTRPNVTYRVFVYAAPATNQTDGSAEIIGPNQFTGVVRPTNCIVLYDSVVNANQGSTMVTPGYERSSSVHFTCPINKPVVYDPLGSVPQTRLIVFVTPYDSWGTLTTDNIASIAQGSWRIDFTDT